MTVTRRARHPVPVVALVLLSYCSCWQVSAQDADADAKVAADAKADAAVLASKAACGDPFGNLIGPFDYTNPVDRSKPRGIGLIEQYHFDAGVESLRQGLSSENVMGDLDYTLRAVPNHHRALNSVARYELELGGIPRRWRSAECWFTRAVTFKQDDAVVWMLYGNFLAKQKQWTAAREKYLRAKELMPKNIEIDYNLGLLYVNTQEYEKAVQHARIAYAQNYPLRGLRNMLARRGYQLSE